MDAGGVRVTADDLTHVVDGGCNGALSGQGIIEREEGTVAVTEEAVVAVGVVELSDDLT